MFDPHIGRWISEDLLEFEAGDENLNRYVGNNPTSLIDPSGLIKVGSPHFISRGSLAWMDGFMMGTPFSDFAKAADSQVESLYNYGPWTKITGAGQAGPQVYLKDEYKINDNLTIPKGSARAVNFLFFVVWPICLEGDTVSVETFEKATLQPTTIGPNGDVIPDPEFPDPHDSSDSTPNVEREGTSWKLVKGNGIRNGYDMYLIYVDMPGSISTAANFPNIPNLGQEYRLIDSRIQVISNNSVVGQANVSVSIDIPPGVTAKPTFSASMGTAYPGPGSSHPEDPDPDNPKRPPALNM